MTDAAYVPEEIEDEAQEDYAVDLAAILEAVNLVGVLTEQQVTAIAMQARQGYDIDRNDRAEREDEWRACLELASQVRKPKSYPWPGAANVKYPLLTVATLQFAARAYPALVAGRRPVKVTIPGYDPDGEKARKADRISSHMSWQLLHGMKGWEASQDTLLHVIPIMGCAFKKVYRNAFGTNESDLIMPMDLVLPMFAKSVSQTPRLTHVLHMTDNEVRERQLAGMWADVPLGSGATQDDERRADPSDDDGYRDILECHCWYDIDGDGYKEPYIVTQDYASSAVLRIVARFDPEGIEMAPDGRIARIRPNQYFVKYGFVPAFDGSVYDYGFGKLLGPINETVNTTVNQLLDAGTLSNTQGGFISRNLRMKSGENYFKPGEWKIADSRGQTFRDAIYPLPVREPSAVLFNLLNFMVAAGKEIASISDAMLGRTPGQNTPASTTLATIEQGAKVYNAVIKRLWRDFSEELQLLFDLNRRYMTGPEQYRIIDGTPGKKVMTAIADRLFEMMVKQGMAMGLDEATARTLAQEEFQGIDPAEIAELAQAEEFGQVVQSDYQGDATEVYPASDPDAASEMLNRAKADFLVQMMQLGAPFDPMKAWTMIMEAYGVDPTILVPPNPQADPMMVMEMREQDRKDADVQARIQNNTAKVQIDAARAGVDLERGQAETARTLAEAERTLAEVDAMPAEQARETARTVADIRSAERKPEKTGER